MKAKQTRDADLIKIALVYIFHIFDGWAVKYGKRAAILFGVILVFCHSARGQIIERGNKAYGVFSPTVTKVNNGIFLYTYQITNADSSKQVLNSFRIAIQDPSYYEQNKSVLGPENKKWYIDALSKGYITGSAASRFVDIPSQNGLKPGESMIISFQSQGLPAIMHYYTRGFVKSLTMTEFDSLREVGYTDDEIFMDYEEEAHQGTTISPKVWPDNVEKSEFTDTLMTYLDRSCTELGWIQNQGLCRSLQAKLDNVKKQLDRGNTNAAKGPLQAFINEVQAQKGKQLSSEAYALLYFNGQYLLERLNQ